MDTIIRKMGHLNTKKKERNIVTESAGENGPGATLCFWGTKAGPGIHSGLKWVWSTLSHVGMQSLCICIYVS